ncbi:MAG: CapA family protein, partial [Acidimicrobiia bacterium]
MTIAAVGGGAYLLRAGRDARVVTASSTTTTTTTTTTRPPASAPPVTAPPRDPILGNGQPVTFAFGGDSHFQSHLRRQLTQNPTGMLGPIAPVLSAADVAVVNLETALTERGTRLDKQYTFRVPGTALGALAAAGVDAASNANNHAIDFGPDGLADTLSVKQFTGFPLIGVGANAAEAYAPYRLEVRGQRIAVFAATDVLDGFVVNEWPATETRAGIASAKDVGPLLDVITAARADSDTIVVFMH